MAEIKQHLIQEIKNKEQKPFKGLSTDCNVQLISREPKEAFIGIKLQTNGEKQHTQRANASTKTSPASPSGINRKYHSVIKCHINPKTR